MYRSVIGRRLLEIYNRERKRKLTAQEFFEKEIFEKFYNHKKYFKWVVNSPFVQKLSQKERKGTKTFEDEQRRKLEKLYQKIEKDVPDSSFAIGFPSATETVDTSGQVSSMNVPMDKETIFLSWIGAGLGLEIEGGQVWYIDDEELLWTLYKGWEVYREQLDSKSIDLKAKEIDAWNAAWIEYKYNRKRITPKFIIDSYVDKITTGKDRGKYAIRRVNWISMVFRLAQIFPNRQITIFSASYIFKKQKYNTIGFLVFMFPEVQRLFEFYPKIFAQSNVLKNKNLEAIYKAEMNFERASTLGVIGLRALEPSDLRKYMEDKKLKEDINEITISNYKLWIIAMLNKEEILYLAKEAAQQLYNYFDRSEKGTRNKREQVVKEILTSRRRESLFDALNNLSDSDLQYALWVKRISDNVMLNIAPDNIHLFVTLIKTEYNAIKAQSFSDNKYKETK